MPDLVQNVQAYISRYTCYSEMYERMSYFIAIDILLPFEYAPRKTQEI